MTTHYQKIQALGNRMASNLETMGVSASFNDGGLTLADKILQIQRFNNGLILYADKNIAQSSDTVKVYACLLKDGIAQSGKTVTFSANVPISSRQMPSGYTSLGDDYYVSSSKTGTDKDRIGIGHTGFIEFNSTSIDIFDNSSSSWRGAVTYTGGLFHIKEGVLTYKDTSNVEQTIDVSSIDTSRAYADIYNFTVYYCEANVTTDSNGIATLSYTCSGAGKITFSAKNGSIQSEPYTVWDTLMYDNIYTSSKWTLGSAITVDTADTYATIKSTGSNTTTGSSYTVGSFSGDIEVILEANITYNGAWGFYFGLKASSNHSLAQVKVSGWKYLKFQRVSGVCSAYISSDGSTWEEMTMYSDNVGNNTANFEIMLYTSAVTDPRTIDFKNLKVYKL